MRSEAAPPEKTIYATTPQAKGASLEIITQWTQTSDDEIFMSAGALNQIDSEFYGNPPVEQTNIN